MSDVTRTLGTTVVVCLAVCAMACTSAEVEYDRMTGTVYPQSVTVAGDTVDFTSIYLQGDILLSVDEDDTAITPLTGPANPLDPNQYDYINPAEIDALEIANRDATVAPT